MSFREPMAHVRYGKNTELAGDTRRGAPDVHPRGGQGVPQGLAEKQSGLVYAPVALPCEKALSLLRRKAAHGKSAWNVPRAFSVHVRRKDS